MSEAVALPGFAEPVSDAQAIFRAVLDAMARPGRVHRIAMELTAPLPLDRVTAAVLLALVDHETPLWLDPAAAGARDWLAFHCGATMVEQADAAAFALALSLPDLGMLSPGTHEAPETSATLILQVAALGAGTRYRLAGPGLRAPTSLAVRGLPVGFVQAWQQNHASFPRGIDIILCSDCWLTALPRSVSIEEA